MDKERATMQNDVWVYSDGGRCASGYKGTARDCFTRSVAIITGKDYQEVYDEINALGQTERTGKRKRGKSTARTGVYTRTARKYLKSLGYEWTPTMFIGQGCKIHLKADELPTGRLIVCVSRHYTAMIDGVVQDTHDPTRNGVRCVYGYYKKA